MVKKIFSKKKFYFVFFHVIIRLVENAVSQNPKSPIFTTFLFWVLKNMFFEGFAPRRDFFCEKFNHTPWSQNFSPKTPKLIGVYPHQSSYTTPSGNKKFPYKWLALSFPWFYFIFRNFIYHQLNSPWCANPQILWV